MCLMTFPIWSVFAIAFMTKVALDLFLPLKNGVMTCLFCTTGYLFQVGL